MTTLLELNKSVSRKLKIFQDPEATDPQSAPRSKTYFLFNPILNNRAFTCSCWWRACLIPLIRVMPLMRFIADVLGVLTICLVTILFLVGLICILYSIYFRTHILRQGRVSLSYFSGPWIIRIAYIIFSIWWGFGEIIRLNLLRHKGRFLDSTSRLHETICKCYIVSNLGFAEPCLFLTLTLLIRASIQRSGTLSPKWNAQTAGFVLLYCLPMLLLQLAVILIGPEYKKFHNPKLPAYFITASSTSKTNGDGDICTYPLFSTIFLGLFATLLSGYILWIGRQILHWVINKGLQRRVYTLIFSVCSLFPLRAVLLGLTVLPKPEKLSFDAITFLAFLSLFCCVLIGVCLLVYLPVADSLSLRNFRDLEARMGVNNGHHDDDETVTLMAANQSPRDRSLVTDGPRRESGGSVVDSISFRATGKDEDSEVTFVELTTMFNQDQHLTPLGSPRPLGRTMISP